MAAANRLSRLAAPIQCHCIPGTHKHRTGALRHSSEVWPHVQNDRRIVHKSCWEVVLSSSGAPRHDKARTRSAVKPEYVRIGRRSGSSASSLNKATSVAEDLGVFDANLLWFKFRPILYNPYRDIFKSSFVVIWLIRFNTGEPHL